jgi:hypothetical protein
MDGSVYSPLGDAVWEVIPEKRELVVGVACGTETAGWGEEMQLDSSRARMMNR